MQFVIYVALLCTVIVSCLPWDAVQGQLGALCYVGAYSFCCPSTFRLQGQVLCLPTQRSGKQATHGQKQPLYPSLMLQGLLAQGFNHFPGCETHTSEIGAP